MNVRELLIRVGFEGEQTVPELDKIDRKVDKVKESFLSLNTILSTLFVGGALKGLFGIGDAMQRLQAQIGNSTQDMENANARLNDLAKHANDNRTSIEAYADSWGKMNQGISRFGGTTEDTTTFVDTLSAAFKSNGTSAESANAALFQLGQTMQSGVVQGEEMNSFLDAQGTLANEVMTAIGGTVIGYKKMQAAGQVTAKMLMDAVNKQYPKYMAQLKAMPLALGDVWTIVLNDVKMGIANVNDETKAIPRIARYLMDAWNKLKTTAGELLERIGGLDNALQSLARVAAPLAILLGVLKGFQVLSMLATPTGMVIALAGAIGLLYDDYRVWKDGGESLIDWEEWEGPINNAIDSTKDLAFGVRDLAKAFGELLGIDLSKWTLKGELEDLSKHMKELVDLGQNLADVINHLSAGEFKEAASSFKKAWSGNNPEQNTDALPGVTASAESVFKPDRVVYQRPEWWPDWLGGKGQALNAMTQAQPLAPGNTPSRVQPNVTVTAPVTATINIQQQPGESGDALAARVTDALRKQQQPAFDPRSLLIAGGAK